MILFNHNGIHKLSHSKPCNGITLRDSLVTSLWGFVLLISQTITMKKLLFSAVFGLLLLPSLTFASFDISLKYGSRGDAVSDLQDFLTDQNVYTGKVDGKFGLGTVKAVKAFQTANNLTPDGYFGKGSRAVASTLLAAELKPSDDAEQAETGTVSPATSFLPGCTSLSGFSVTTGHPCNSTTPEPVVDTGTQAAINSLSQQVQNLTTQLQTQQTSIPVIVQPTSPSPITITATQPICNSTTTSQWSINTDWFRVNHALIEFGGGGLLLYKDSPPYTPPTSGTMNYTLYAFDKPYVSPLPGQIVDISEGAIASSSGSLVFPDCSNFSK